MKPFFRAVLMSLRYKWSILGAVLCAVMISVLWSASISTILPVVQVVLQGETFHDWIDTEIENSTAAISKLESEIQRSELKISVAPISEDELHRTQLSLDINRDRLSSEQHLLRRYTESLKPFITKWAPDSPFETLSMAMGWLLVVTLLKGCFLVASAYLTARVASKTVMDLRRIYYRKALELDQQRIDRLGTSNMMTHLSHNMLMVAGGLKVFYGKCLREPLKMVTCLALAAWISLPLLLLSLIILPAGFFLVRNVSGRMKRSTENEMQGMADVFQTLIETFQKVKTVRIFNRERSERRRFRRNAQTLYHMSVRISLYDSLLKPLSELLGIISIAVAILAGAWLVLNRETSLFGIRMSETPIRPVTLLYFYALLAAASDPARKMTEVINVIVRGNTACENLFRTYDVDNRVKTPEFPVPVPKHSEAIVFDDVLFSYKPKQPVLRRISLEIPYKQTLAIVGGNGSGKSTLMNLLCRFYDPNRGHITIDGVDLKDVSPRKLRRQIAWVTQDSVLFHGTIRENILYGNPDATEKDLDDAVRTARLGDFMDSMPEGIDTMIGDNGSHLSAGQRQRVAIARAVLADPRILILDEATSQVDGQTETLIHGELESFIRGRTTIIVTHRASSLCLANRVIVMRLGRIVSDSTVEEAMESSRPFQNLFARSA
ncbi:ABC transporter ATP-binding protein [Mariniblastus fucicola]|uniref:Lipid A export ATP-binding/permease protein MsbA n=1 Tax=Mariniblastus fucicola TaxID=980251 RepID=A0A5B9PF33_9BACT|nr:ABC transporter ATP-binding protein [Mariniblastus fucicola]QEG23492.1 Lipid A export ATP-binding/permease protein MsbA [Mariniblastus fucicola]